jgi:hypothetical protein
MKIKTVKLSYPHAPLNPSHTLYDETKTPAERQAAFDAERRYRIEAVTDSTELHPGNYLETKEVEGLCRSTAWKVTIVATK